MVFRQTPPGLLGVLLNTKATDKQEVVRNFLCPVLATHLDSYEAYITEGFIHTVSILDFYSRHGGKKAHLGLGPLTFAKRDQNIIQTYYNDSVAATDMASVTTSSDILNQGLDNPMLPKSLDGLQNLLQRMKITCTILFTKTCKIVQELPTILAALSAAHLACAGQEQCGAFQFGLGARCLLDSESGVFGTSLVPSRFSSSPSSPLPIGHITSNLAQIWMTQPKNCAEGFSTPLPKF